MPRDYMGSKQEWDDELKAAMSVENRPGVHKAQGWGHLRTSHDEDQPTLRDQFAMAVLPTLIEEGYTHVRMTGIQYEVPVGKVAAEHAYEIADFMMEARKK